MWIRREPSLSLGNGVRFMFPFTPFVCDQVSKYIWFSRAAWIRTASKHRDGSIPSKEVKIQAALFIQHILHRWNFWCCISLIHYKKHVHLSVLHRERNWKSLRTVAVSEQKDKIHNRDESHAHLYLIQARDISFKSGLFSEAPPTETSTLDSQPAGFVNSASRVGSFETSPLLSVCSPCSECLYFLIPHQHFIITGVSTFPPQPKGTPHLSSLSVQIMDISESPCFPPLGLL